MRAVFVALLGAGIIAACGTIIEEQLVPVPQPVPEAGVIYVEGGGPTPEDAAANEAGALDAGPDGWAHIAEACAPQFRALGSFATHNGKVNVHTLEDGGWAVDIDCVSGANIIDVDYCKKFWAASTEVRQLDASDRTEKPFYNAACLEYFPTVGERQYVCCGPF